jgi:hypothetical protein
MPITKKILEARKRLGKIEPSKMEYKNVKYDYLAEEEITSKVKEIFDELGILIYPYEVTTSYPKDGLTEAIITYYVVDTDDDSSIEISSVGQGFDASDKGSPKAMTSAYKYAMRQLLMIPSPERDPDKQSTVELTEKKTYTPKAVISTSGDKKAIIIPFGKRHKGKTLGEVLVEDRPYVEWLAGHEGDLQQVAKELLRDGE